jgi:hypothetical protein
MVIFQRKMFREASLSYRDGADGEGKYVGETGDGDSHPGVLQGLTHHLMQGQP